jgi:hypothetical protein
MARPRYVVIELRCVTFLRCRRLSAVAIWEHVAQRQDKNTAAAIDALVFPNRGKMMASDPKTGNDPESKFSFGVRELRAANVEQELSVNVAPLKAANENRGVDPYNTSGSFDRKKNWARIGKR